VSAAKATKNSKKTVDRKTKVWLNFKLYPMKAVNKGLKTKFKVKKSATKG